jgi:hypothetical protein
MRTALAHILDIPEKKKIPFAMIYGNHDDMNSFTGDEQAEIFRAYSMNRGFENTGDLCGTYRLPVYSSDGEKQLLNLWMMNTAWHDKELDKCFNDITEKQVEWFRNESASQKEINGGKGIRIDYIFVSEEFKVTKAEIPQSKASDHLPYYAELELD